MWAVLPLWQTPVEVVPLDKLWLCNSCLKSIQYLVCKGSLKKCSSVVMMIVSIICNFCINYVARRALTMTSLNSVEFRSLSCVQDLTGSMLIKTTNVRRIMSLSS